MMGYNNEQFFNLVNKGVIDNENELNPDQYSNPPFLFPGPTRRQASAPNPNGQTWLPKGVKRGFIKMLPQLKGVTADAVLGKRKCFFQFNPQTILRNVQMRSDMMQPLLQDPGQFTAPVPGDAGFAFDLLFDRQFEINRSTNLVYDSGDASAAYNPFDETSEDALLTAGPNSIGVLADLRVLDAIIGQGISKDLVDYMLARGKIVNSWQTSDTTVTTTTPDTEEDSDSTETDSTTTSTSSSDAGSGTWDDTKVRENLNRNIGNQAFLIPNPVRVVFSSLFMVDGFVTGMAVNFVKFNQAMVPVQCSISIQMQALYIGFARKETYLTWALENAEEKPIDVIDGPEVTVDAEAKERTKALLFGADGEEPGLKDFKAQIERQTQSSFSWNPGEGKAEDWDQESFSKNNGLLGADIYAEDIYIIPSYNSLGNTYVSPSSPDIWKGTTNVNYKYLPAAAGRPVVGWKFGFKQDGDTSDDKIYKAFEDGEITSFSYTMEINITRPRTLTAAERAGTNKQPVKVMSFSASFTSTTKEEWQLHRRINGESGIDDETKELGTLTNNAHTDDRLGLMLNITDDVVTSMKVERWQENCISWLKNNRFSLSVVVRGSVIDEAGNVIRFSGSGNKSVYHNDLLGLSFKVSPQFATTLGYERE